MSTLRSLGAPDLVVAVFAVGALLFGLFGWGIGAVVALRKNATRRGQNIGLTLVVLGSLGFLGCMIGVHFADSLAAHLAAIYHTLR